MKLIPYLKELLLFKIDNIIWIIGAKISLHKMIFGAKSALINASYNAVCFFKQPFDFFLYMHEFIPSTSIIINTMCGWVLQARNYE